MGEFAIGDQTLSYEQIAQSDAQHRYLLEITFRPSPSKQRETERKQLDTERRQGATRDRIETALREWFTDRSDSVVIESYEVLEQIGCRRGALVETDAERGESDASSSSSTKNTEPGVDASVISEGDRVAYYVQGPDSSVYGYISEGIIERVPPWEEGPPSRSHTVTEEVLLDLGDRTKKIPLEWIIGSTDDPDIDAVIDRRRDAFH